MVTLILGLLIFLGVHSIRIVADGWRSAQITRFGERPWKLVHSLISIVGLALVILGYGQARQHHVFLWTPPAGALHLTALLVLMGFILIAAAYIPRNHIKARLHHPMVLGIQLWTIGHLVANGTLASLFLFGSFLIWAIFSYLAARRRDQATDVSYASATVSATSLAIVVGVLVWLAFLFRLHTVLIGVPLIL